MSYQSTVPSLSAQEDLLALQLEQYRRRGIWIGYDAVVHLFYWTNQDGHYGGSALDLFTLCRQLDEHFRAGRR